VEHARNRGNRHEEHASNSVNRHVEVKLASNWVEEGSVEAAGSGAGVSPALLCCLMEQRSLRLSNAVAQGFLIRSLRSDRTLCHAQKIMVEQHFSLMSND
jgi:hypothetical protein